MINEREVFILIYLDNAATTKAFEKVLDTYLRVNQSVYYNPNSPHKTGSQANQLLQQAKAQINAMISSKTDYDIVFTGGAIESNSLALKGIVYHKFDTVREIVTSMLEHPSVLEVVGYLEAHEGSKVEYVDVKKDGSISLKRFKELVSDEVGLVTCVYVNNIAGQIQSIPQITRAIKNYPEAYFHVDAIQAFGKISMGLNNVDNISLSGHKFNGLKGQGVLLVDHIQSVEPAVHGGGQEYGTRSGIVNLPNDITMIKMMKIVNEGFETLSAFVTKSSNDVRQFLDKYHGVYINSPISSLSFVLGISFPGVKGEVLVNVFSKYDIMMSTTSACSSKRNKLDEILAAMGLSDKSIEDSIGLSFGAITAREDIAGFKEVFIIVYEEIKELLK